MAEFQESFIILDDKIVKKEYEDLIKFFLIIKKNLSEIEYEYFKFNTTKFLSLGPIYKSFIIDDEIIYKFCGFYYS